MTPRSEYHTNMINDCSLLHYEKWLGVAMATLRKGLIEPRNPVLFCQIKKKKYIYIYIYILRKYLLKIQIEIMSVFIHNAG
jgi:uncharacterized membrane protein